MKEKKEVFTVYYQNEKNEGKNFRKLNTSGWKLVA